MADKPDFKKIYAEASKKYKLPEFDFLDSEFEIGTIESERFTVREVRRRMHDKVELVCKMLEGILQPETTLNSMYESGVFADDEKKNIYLVYKDLMSFLRMSIKLEIDCDDLADAKFIKEFAEKWKKHKPYLSSLLLKLQQSWTKESEIEEKLGYFG